MKRSWKTSLGGIIAAIGTVLIALPDPDWLSKLGAGLVGLGGAIAGLSARDNKVSSEDVGVK